MRHPENPSESEEWCENWYLGGKIGTELQGIGTLDSTDILSVSMPEHRGLWIWLSKGGTPVQQCGTATCLTPGARMALENVRPTLSDSWQTGSWRLTSPQPYSLLELLLGFHTSIASKDYKTTFCGTCDEIIGVFNHNCVLLTNWFASTHS